MSIMGFLNHLFFHEKPKAPMKRPQKSASSKEAAEAVLREFFSKNRPRHGR